MTYQHEFVMKLNPEYEKHLEFTVCAVVQPNRWVSEHVRLKKLHAQTTQLLTPLKRGPQTPQTQTFHSVILTHHEQSRE
jgi:hypothetical protein